MSGWAGGQAQRALELAGFPTSCASTQERRPSVGAGRGMSDTGQRAGAEVAREPCVFKSQEGLLPGGGRGAWTGRCAGRGRRAELAGALSLLMLLLFCPFLAGTSRTRRMGAGRRPSWLRWEHLGWIARLTPDQAFQRSGGGAGAGVGAGRAAAATRQRVGVLRPRRQSFGGLQNLLMRMSFGACIARPGSASDCELTWCGGSALV